MIESNTLLQILRNNGLAIYILGFCSILSLAIIFERLRAFRLARRLKLNDFMAGLRASLEKGRIQSARDYCTGKRSPFASVALAALDIPDRNEERMMNAMDRQITKEKTGLERYLTILGTIGSMAVYIGLFGTVLGIIHSFQSISSMSGGGLSMVIEGIAEALVSTAAGIIVAVPAVAAYNLMIRSVNEIASEMELCSSETADLLRR